MSYFRSTSPGPRATTAGVASLDNCFRTLIAPTCLAQFSGTRSSSLAAWRIRRNCQFCQVSAESPISSVPTAVHQSSPAVALERLAPFIPGGAISLRRNALVLALYCFAIVLPCSAPTALGQCGAEAKLLVSPRDVQESVAALHAGTELRGEVYLFDTGGLELLSQGAILRLRTGVRADLTVKLRSGEGEKQKDPSEGKEAFKCEVDLVGNSALTSHSLRRAWKSKQIPETGEALHAALSAGQLRLLTAGRISIDCPAEREKARNSHDRAELAPARSEGHIAKAQGGVAVGCEIKAGAEVCNQARAVGFHPMRNTNIQRRRKNLK